MAGVTETREWTEEVYRFEESDPVQGGEDGIDNAPHKHLANRTKFLKEMLEFGTQTVVMIDDDGDIHHMVWVPRFTVPAEAIAEGVPSEDLHLGGIMVDKYHSQAKEYIGDIKKAVCRPMEAPETMVTLVQAREYSARRTFNGLACHVLTVQEWGQLAWLVALFDYGLRGNIDDGKDNRDSEVWENYAEPGYAAPSLGGTGPITWFHNRLRDGIADLIGNVTHLLDPGQVANGVLRTTHGATLVNAINDSDPSFELEDPMGLYSPEEGFKNWPASNGLLYVEGEFIIYGELVPTPGSPHRATVTGCQRGQYGTGAAGHDADVACNLRLYHCLIPDGYAAYVDDDGLDNTDPGSATFAWTWGIFQHGTHDEVPTPGTVLACESEDLLVDSVDGSNITVTRGHNGTAIAAHADGMVFAQYPPDTDLRASQGEVIGWATEIRSNHPDLEALYIPGQISPDAPVEEPVDLFRVNITSLLAGLPMLRGENYQSSISSSMLGAYILGTTTPSTAYGFRCAFRPLDNQYGGEPVE